VKGRLSRPPRKSEPAIVRVASIPRAMAWLRGRSYPVRDSSART
jgi:hypothetical protein